jgi:type 1 glutamine amidotransferase
MLAFATGDCSDMVAMMKLHAVVLAAIWSRTQPMPLLRHFARAAMMLLATAILSAAPVIDSSYPPANDVRRPDRTLARDKIGRTDLIIYTADGRSLVTADPDRVIRIWDARTGEQGTGELQHELTGATGAIVSIAFRDEGKTLVAAEANGVIDAWDITSGKLGRQGDLKRDLTGAIFQPGAEPRLLVRDNRELQLLDYASGTITRRFSVPSGMPITAMAFSFDGSQLAAADEKGSLWVWETTSGTLRRTVAIPQAIRRVAVSATHVAAATANGRVLLVETAGATAPTSVAAHESTIDAIAFSPRGEQIVTAGGEHTVKVWDIATARLLCIQTGHAHPVTAAIFNPNGQKMASADSDGTVNYWTVPLPPIAPDDLAKITAAMPAKATATPKKPRRLLVFWRADAILHKNGVPAANHAIELLGEKTGAFTADFSRDYEALDSKVLANYDTLVLNSTAHLVIPDSAKQALLDFARRGGGVVGIHAAIDTFRQWPEGAAIVGATFGGHPWGPAGTWAVKIEDPDHPLLRAFGGRNFKIRDELYEMDNPYQRGDRRVLLTADLSDPATAGVTPLHRADKDFALSWIKRFGEGRVFYCVFGHIAEPFENPAVLQFYLDGIQYALGDLDVDASPLPAQKH